ncbi:MAG: prolyl oligopeptidase family serine peptidase, partial [Planctomycetes bacterium]|nr:prolyl oligopeptidase family serine peptidase [Planctomycetota bacterium]
QDAPFAAVVTPTSDQKTLTVASVTFPSPAPSGTAPNDTVYGDLFEPKTATDAAVVILPIWQGGDTTLERLIAHHLARRGLAAFVMDLPYQFHRSPPGVRSGSLTLSSDQERTQASFAQGVQDAQRAAAFLVRERGIARDKVGIMGVSLGGFFSAVAYGATPTFKAGVFVLAGGDLAEILWHDSRETARIKRESIEHGIDLPTVRRLCLPFDPLSWATPEKRRGVLLVNAVSDEVVPFANARKLWQSYGKPRWIKMPGDHYSVAVFITLILEEVRDHFARELKPTW